MAIRGIGGQIAHGDSFYNDRHPDLKADFILANPPFNVSDWGGDRLVEDKRWRYGIPPKGNANFAWVQHMVHHLAPKGVAGFVLANGSMSSNQSGEGEIRKNLIEAELVDCMVALAGPALLLDSDSCLPVVSGTRASSEKVRSYSSMLGSSAEWWTGRIVSLLTKTLPASPTPTMLGASARLTTAIPMSPASARVRHWKRCVSMGRC